MSTPYKLPAGLIGRDGSIYRDVLLSPFTGRVHREIAQQDVRTSPTRVFNTILSNCIEEIEGFGKPTQSILRQMLVGDRDFCAVKIRQLTWDSPVVARTQCDSCSRSNNVEIDLDNLTIYELDESHYDVVDVDGKPTRVFTVENIPPNDLSAKFKYICGEDQEAISGLLMKNPIEAEFKMFQRALVEWEGELMPNVPKEFFDDLSMDTTAYLANEFNNAQPGPDTLYAVSCPECYAENTIGIFAGDFLFKSQTSRSRTRWMR